MSVRFYEFTGILNFVFDDHSIKQDPKLLFHSKFREKNINKWMNLIIFFIIPIFFFFLN